MERFSVRTARQMQVIDITENVELALAKSGLNEGVCNVFVPHATAAVIINEHEPNLGTDMLTAFGRMIPKENYLHNRIDDNAEAHLLSSLLGPSVVIPVCSGKLALGTWQRILLCEFDGPRERTVLISFFESALGCKG